MTTFAIRLLQFLVIAYVAVAALLFVFQSRFIYPAPQTRAALTPGFEEVTIETDDGLQLRAFYRRAAEGLPTILYFHGNGGTLTGASVSNAAAVEAGIGALLVEYRGYGGNPGTPSETGFYSDGAAAARWLRVAGVAPGRTLVMGNSIGAGVASRIALDMVEEGTPPMALALSAPFTSLPDVASQKLRWLPVRALLREAYDNRTRLGEIGDIPVLIQHGSDDTLIPDTHGRALAELAAQAEFQSFEGSGHGLSFEPRSQVARRDWILGLDAKPAR